jgi:hypothetical protein
VHACSAYCSYADAAFPPVFFAFAYAATRLGGGVPLILLLPALLAAALGGLWFSAVVLAGGSGLTFLVFH